MHLYVQNHHAILSKDKQKEEIYFEKKLEHFLNKLVKIWFMGILFIGIPYFLFICIKSLFIF